MVLEAHSNSLAHCKLSNQSSPQATSSVSNDTEREDEPSDEKGKPDSADGDKPFEGENVEDQHEDEDGNQAHSSQEIDGNGQINSKNGTLSLSKDDRSEK